MSNRYWISVARDRAGGGRRRRVCRRACSSQPAVPSLEVGTSLPQPRALRGLRAGGHAGRAGITRLRCAAIRRWCSSASRIARMCARRRWRCWRACRNRRARNARPQGGAHQRRSGARHAASSSASTSRHSAAILSASPAAPPEIVKATRELRRRRQPRRSRRRQLHHGSLGHGIRARFARRASSRCSRRRCRAAALARDLARLAPVLGRRAHERAAPGAAGRAFVALQHLLPQHGISRLVLAATRSRSPAFKNALIRLFVRGFKPGHERRRGTEPDRLRELQRILHARAARRARARGCGSARHRLAGRRHGERSRHAQRRPPAAGQGPRIHAARAARRQRRLGAHLRRRQRSRLSTWRPTTITASTCRWPASCARASTCPDGCSA